MMLQFLIPQYREDEKIISNLLNSIALQQHINFNEISAIICNDGSSVLLSDDFLARFPYKITYIKAEHKGVSATRNTCLHEATSQYIMFCDADDMFCTTHELWQILNSLQNNPCDILVCDYLEEWETSKGYTYRTSTTANHTIHGKIFNRNFLIEKNIWWNETLTNIEDNYFCYLAYSETESIGYYHYTTYIYSNVHGSITHSDDYDFFSVLDLLKTYKILIKEFLRRNKINDARQDAFMIAIKIYFILNTSNWLLKSNEKYRIQVEKSFKDFYNTFDYLIEQNDEETKINIFKGQREIVENQWGPFIEIISFKNWINHILDLK